MTDEPSPPAPAGTPPDLSPFGFDASDAWADHVRAAEAGSPLGTLGAYELLEVASRGAQGIVYRARERETGRIVALKRLIGGALASGPTRARFAREALVDATLSHPNVVSASGLEDADGQAVLAMEWIDGLPVDRWAAGGPGGARRPVEEVLGVFVKVCEGVRHAHQRGVIHRDLKPSNILVDGGGEPHVLDFGLARLTGAAGEGAETLTRSEGFVGTLAYAAPEQLRGRRDGIDVRTDVYALGVVLYQALTGRLPFEDRGDLGAMVESIQRADPPRPSSFNAGVDADLDAIVARALAKEPERRYQSADALIADLGRRRGGLPVEARRGNRWYVLRRTLRRHRVPAATAAAFVLVLAGAFAATLAAWRQAERRQREAVEAAEVAAAINQFLNEDLLASADPRFAQGREVTVREILDNAARDVETRFAGKPLVEAAVRATLGNTFAALGDFPAGEAHLRRALELRRTSLGEEHPDTAASLADVGAVLAEQTRYDEAGPLIRRALEVRRRQLGPDHRDTLDSARQLGAHLVDTAQLDEAEAVLGEAAARAPRALPADDPGALAIRVTLGRAYLARSRTREAEAVLLPALAALRRVRGPADPQTLDAIVLVGEAHELAGRYDLQEALLAEAVEVCTRVLGPEHPRTLAQANNQGLFFRNHGRLAEAEAIYQRVLAAQERILGEEHAETLTSMHNLAALWRDLGRLDRAEPMSRRAIAAGERVLGPDHPSVLTMRTNLAMVFERTGRHEEAEALYREIFRVQRRDLGDGQRNTIATSINLALFLRKQGRFGEAEEVLRPCVEASRTTTGAGSAERTRLLNALALVMASQGKTQEAIALHREVLAVRRSTLKKDHPDLGITLDNLAMELTKAGEFAEAETAFREAEAIFRACADEWGLGICLREFGAMLNRAERFAEAEPVLRETLAIEERKERPDAIRRATIRGDLGHSLAHQGEDLAPRDPPAAAAKYEEAERLLLWSWEALRAHPGAAEGTKKTALTRLAALYAAWGRPERAAEFLALRDGTPAPPP